MIVRPNPQEYNPYYEGYVSKITETDILSALAGQPEELRKAVGGLGEEMGTHTYAPGKWTIKELLSHIIDGERIFGYRVLRISRGDATPIEGFEQDDYIATSNANERTFADLLEEFDLHRRSNILMIRNISDQASQAMGTASDSPISARALVWIIGGHVRHHVGVLRDRYLS